jgi:hypothetical protein
MNTAILRNVSRLMIISVVIASATYAFNLWFFSSGSHLTATDAAFLEGIIFILMGVLFLLGSGGISRASRQAAMLAATANAVSGKQVIGPSEIFRRDSWKPKGFTFWALTLIIAGSILIAIYFASL